MYLPLWPSVVFALMALGFSIFYGLKATTIFPREDHKGAALWHQRWFNVSGSVRLAGPLRHGCQVASVLLGQLPR